MFRISRDDQPSQTVITIDGDLTGECVGVADSYCSQILEHGRCVLVVLREVSAVDNKGRELLLRLVKAGAGLRGIGMYTSYVVAQVNRAVAQPSQVWSDSR